MEIIITFYSLFHTFPAYIIPGLFVCFFAFPLLLSGLSLFYVHGLKLQQLLIALYL